MVRTRQLGALVAWLLAIGWAATACSANASGTVPAPAPPAFSPTKVLADLAGKIGHIGFPGHYGQTELQGSDRSLAPYLMVVGEGHGATEQVPLKETTADMTIAGVIARVQVRQVFENTGRAPIEAVYVFPASTRAAVHGVRMKIGARTIEAKIDKRAAARESYETARREGRRASLLEQERANVFMMNVANVMPGDRITVEMDYSEMLVPAEGVYELVYPTVVGPRYPGGADPAKDKWIANPHLPAGAPEPYRFDVKVHLETGIPIKELSSPSHQVTVKYPGPAQADVALGVPGGGNRDFVLRYRLAGDRIESGLLLWEGQRDREGQRDQGDQVGQRDNGRRENFFALMLEPPQRPQLAQIPPREFIILLDVSGSMHGFPLDTAKELMRNLLGRLRPTDTFNIATFAGAANVMFPDGSMLANKAKVAHAVAEIERQRGGGGTELLAGLQRCYDIPKRDPKVSRTVVVVTDGYVGIEAQVFRFIREKLAEANLFAFGIGTSVNRGLIEGMARAGQGEPFVVLRPEKAAAEAEKLLAYIEEPVLTNVNVSFAGLDTYEIAPQKLADLMARRPLVLYGKYRGPAGGRIEISGVTGGGPWRQTVDVRPADVRAGNAALRWLWARRWVDTLEDERVMGGGQPTEDGITSLGLEYKLLTAFTSFVAVDSQVANAGGQQKNVRQPLPMPDGVSNLAVAEGNSTLGLLHSIGRGSATAYGMGGLMGPPRSAGKRHRGEEGKMGKKTSAGDAALYGIATGAGSAAPSTPARADNKAKGGVAKAITWTVMAGKASALGDLAPLVKSLENLLASGSAGCLATTATATGRAKSTQLRLTVDASGKVLRVELLGRDRSGPSCLVKLLSGVSSATGATGAATGTVEVTIRGR